ncbi:MAG: DUF4149 domain-containing protein [Nitrospirota bacterium]|nr:DUF4149 domain-containing protein [Nitrospirota bacterium]
MNRILLFVHRLGIGGWVGAMLAISVLVPPIVFTTLPRRSAGEVMGSIFSAYYLLGIALGVLALVALVLLAWRTGWGRERLAAAVILGVMLAVTGLMKLSVVPAVFEARGLMYQAEDAGRAEAPALRAEMGRLHAMSVRLNGAVLLAGVFVIFLGAMRERAG